MVEQCAVAALMRIRFPLLTPISKERTTMPKEPYTPSKDDPVGICSICKNEIGGRRCGHPKAGVLVGEGMVCHYCIVRDPDRFPEQQDEVVPLIEEELEGYVSKGWDEYLSHVLARCNMDGFDLIGRATRIGRRAAGIPSRAEGRIVGGDGFDWERIVMWLSFYDHPLIGMHEEYRRHCDADDEGCVERITEKHGLKEWEVCEDSGITDLWVGHIPAFVVDLCELGLRFPDVLSRWPEGSLDENGNDRNDSGCWMRSVPRLTQENLDSIRDFMVLVGAVPEGTRFEMGSDPDAEVAIEG